jgi:hypothetical protein
VSCLWHDENVRSYVLLKFLQCKFCAGLNLDFSMQTLCKMRQVASHLMDSVTLISRRLPFPLTPEKEIRGFFTNLSTSRHVLNSFHYSCFNYNNHMAKILSWALKTQKFIEVFKQSKCTPIHFISYPHCVHLSNAFKDILRFYFFFGELRTYSKSRPYNIQ